MLLYFWNYQNQRKVREQCERTYIKPSVTSNTLSLKTNSKNFVKKVPTPRLTEPVTAALLILGIVSVDNQALSSGIFWSVVGEKTINRCYRLDWISSSFGNFRWFGVDDGFWQFSILPFENYNRNQDDCQCHSYHNFFFHFHYFKCRMLSTIGYQYINDHRCIVDKL